MTIPAFFATALLLAAPATSDLWNLSDSTTKHIQEVLREEGLYEGPVDGIPGPSTRRGLHEFQRRNGLPVSDVIDADVARAFGIEPTSLGIRPDVPQGDETAGQAPGGTATKHTGLGKPIGAARRADPGGFGDPGVERTGGRDAVATVRDAQKALLELGFDPGPVDGVLGEQTAAALRRFQAAEGLSVSGTLDARTRAELERAYGRF